MSVIRVDSLDDPRVAPYRDLKRTNLTRDQGYFIAEGTKVVERLLVSRYPVESVLLSERRADEWSTKIAASVPVYVVPQALGESLIGFNFHVGVLACGRRLPSPSLESLVAEASPFADQTSRETSSENSKRSRICLAVCPNCDDPENLGAIIRISAAFGINGLLLGERCCDPFSRRVLRVSMGTAFGLPIIESKNLIHDLNLLRDQWQFELYATVLDHTAERMDVVPRPERLAILFGNEAQGLEKELVELCHRRVTIPMSGGTDSLNVAIAAGIFLHHFTKSCETVS